MYRVTNWPWNALIVIGTLAALNIIILICASGVERNHHRNNAAADAHWKATGINDAEQHANGG